MCRNITVLRGLEPPATEEEVAAAALQYVRKVTGCARPPVGSEDVFASAVAAVADATSRLLAQLPARRNPPTVVPPGRRRSPPV